MELIDGQTFAGRTVHAFVQLPADYLDVATGEATAAVQIYTGGGTEGFIDRVDRATVEAYAPGTAAVDVLEEIHTRLVNGTNPHDLAVGYVDRISPDVTPHDVPYVSEATNQARATYLVTTRLP